MKDVICQKSLSGLFATSSGFLKIILIFNHMCRSILSLFILTAIYLTGCGQRSGGLLITSSDPLVRQILEESMEKSGGISNWESLAKIKFDKIIRIYNAHGELEIQTERHHRYHYQPEKIIEINWQDEQGNHQLLAIDDQATKYVNGQKDSLRDPKAALDHILHAEFTTTLPFRLIDPQFQFTYEGIDTLTGNLIVHVIRAQHQLTSVPGRDTSWHYFNVDNYLHQGFKIRKHDRKNLVINDRYVRTGDFYLPGQRSSYRLDHSGEPRYLWSTEEYRNYQTRKATR